MEESRSIHEEIADTNRNISRSKAAYLSFAGIPRRTLHYKCAWRCCRQNGPNYPIAESRFKKPRLQNAIPNQTRMVNR